MSPEMQQVTQVDLVTDSEILRGIPTTPGTGTIIPSGENLRLTRKQYALKILTLKVATFLRWDLGEYPVEMYCRLSNTSPFHRSLGKKPNKSEAGVATT